MASYPQNEAAQPLAAPYAYSAYAPPQQPPYPDTRYHAAPVDDMAYRPSYEQAGPPQPSASSYYAAPGQDTAYRPSYEQQAGAPQPSTSSKPRKRRMTKKTKRRLYWTIPLCILVLIIAILFEVYKSDFERWASPLTRWLTERDSWSWVIPVGILVILSLPPLFGHEIVQLIVGLAYPLGVAIGIACAGSILGEAFCFVVFKYFGTNYVEKKIAAKVKWAAISRVAQEAGFKGVLVIRYSIVPPHLANPLFACTGMKFWLYMITVILSLPKSIVFVALGSPGSKNQTGVKWAKVVAVAVLVVVTIFASIWIRKKLRVATEEIERERGITHDDDDKDEDMEMDSVLSQRPLVRNEGAV